MKFLVFFSITVIISLNCNKISSFPVFNNHANRMSLIHQLPAPFREWLSDHLLMLAGHESEFARDLNTKRGISFDNITCDTCVHYITVIMEDATSRKSFDTILLNFTIDTCIEVLSFRYNATSICPNLMKLYGPIAWTSIVNSRMSAFQICEYFRACIQLQSPVNSKFDTSRLSLSSPKTFESSVGDIHFVHVSDFHLDVHYSDNSPAICEYFICCHKDFPGNGSALPYGTYGCDLPLTTGTLLLKHLSELSPPPDFIIYGGDNPPHDLWQETDESQRATHKRVVDLFKQYLPNITIYPTIGNHETFPESEYLQDLYSSLTSFLANLWKTWVDFPNEAIDTISLGGYYTMKIREKLRLISFNSDYGYLYNFYSLLNSQNPAFSAQIKWIHRTLSAARDNGEKVLMVGHIPPGIATANLEYSDWYYNLTRLYYDIIVGHLFGHTHQDHFKLIKQTYMPNKIYNNNNNNNNDYNVYGTVLITPSVTPFSHQNPSYRVYTMDATSYSLKEYNQYYLNLTKANELSQQGKTPEFELNYSSKQLYKLSDLSSHSFQLLVDRFALDNALLLSYVNNIHAHSEDSSKCDALCAIETICECSSIDALTAKLCSLYAIF